MMIIDRFTLLFIKSIELPAYFILILSYFILFLLLLAHVYYLCFCLILLLL